MSKLTLFHGSSVVVSAPDVAKCKPGNDYGAGFYCTLDEDLASEWACARGQNGFVNRYSLCLEGLCLIDLEGSTYNVLNWLAVLLANRVCRGSTPTMQQAMQWLTANFSVDLSKADVVAGYRADDSYFSFARAFLRNEITLDQVSEALRLGKLGIQYMVKSPKAFSALVFEGTRPVDGVQWWARRQAREEKARLAFEEMVSDSSQADSSSPFIVDLMRMGKGDLDACLS